MRLGSQQTRIGSRQPKRNRTKGIERGDNVGVDLAHQNHLHDLESLCIGNATAVDKGGLFAHSLEPLTNLWATAMHHYWLHPDSVHHDDIFCKVIEQLGTRHCIAAELDYDDSASKRLDIRQSL